MDNGNVGPGNMNANNFERSMSEAPQFNPEYLRDEEQKEAEPGDFETPSDPNADNFAYLDPFMLGNTTVKTMGLDSDPVGIGEVVSEGEAGVKTLTKDQVTGTDIDVSVLRKNGVSNELAARLDDLKKEKDLRKQSVGLMIESKKARYASFPDRANLVEELR